MPYFLKFLKISWAWKRWDHLVSRGRIWVNWVANPSLSDNNSWSQISIPGFPRAMSQTSSFKTDCPAKSFWSSANCKSSSVDNSLKWMTSALEIIVSRSWELCEVVAMINVPGNGSSQVFKNAFAASEVILSIFSISTTFILPIKECWSQSLISLIPRSWYPYSSANVLLVSDHLSYSILMECFFPSSAEKSLIWTNHFAKISRDSP